MGQWEKRKAGTGQKEKGRETGWNVYLYIYLFPNIYFENFQAHRKI